VEGDGLATWQLADHSPKVSFHMIWKPHSEVALASNGLLRHWMMVVMVVVVMVMTTIIIIVVVIVIVIIIII
jgi:hypothetical protein